MIKTYYLLTKPGIILGNLITTSAGFALAARGHWDGFLFLSMLVGLSAVIASACVFNNYIDRDLDQKMERTKRRAFASGAVSHGYALFFALLLGSIGLTILLLFTNRLAACMAAFGFFIYVILYSFWKRKTSYATLVGSIAGALPPVIGYSAVSGQLDGGAILLFLLLVSWQMPHFFAIAMSRIEDYSAASVPVLPIERGALVTKVQMLLYIIAFLFAILALRAFGFTGQTYLLVALPITLLWLILCLKGFRTDNDQRWARQMFRISLAVVTILSIMITVDVCR